jgi:hypothetical protein
MKASAPPSRRARVWVGVAFALYAWWATGQPPFAARAYLAIAVPAAALAVAVVARGRRAADPAPISRRGALPWLLVLVAAAGLDGVGLALGGRSPDVPTLSTVVDHALRWHGVRFALFCGWLALGWWPVLRDRTAASRR